MHCKGGSGENTINRYHHHHHHHDGHTGGGPPGGGKYGMHHPRGLPPPHGMRGGRYDEEAPPPPLPLPPVNYGPPHPGPPPPPAPGPPAGPPPPAMPPAPPANPDCNMKELNKMFGMTASDIDKYSRVIFPVTFTCFQLMYWIIYQHLSDDEVEDLVYLHPD